MGITLTSDGCSRCNDSSASYGVALSLDCFPHVVIHCPGLLYDKRIYVFKILMTVIRYTQCRQFDCELG